MQNKSWILGLVVLVIIIGLGIWGFTRIDNKKVAGESTNSESEEPTDGHLITGQEIYFDNNASVMYFYQPNCGWCIKESPILEELASEGYRVKPMNAAADPTMWTIYKVSGTPTFVAANGDRLEGYQTKEALKAFLDAHK